jgi:2-polyprenyl-3-methyl-5-hydroxy-6-metoxy-1,4-benzoquinol methylase
MIHPTREHESEMAYWESGRKQAEFVFNLLPKGAAVLDFGCGDGRVAIPMQQMGMDVFAVDAAPEMIKRLVDQAMTHTITHRLKVAVWDGTDGSDLELFPTQFDAVNARAVFIHHAHKDVIRLVQNLAPLIKPGGLLIADWPIGRHHQRIDWIDVTVWDYEHRQAVAESVGLSLVSEGEPGVKPSVWRKQ